MPPFWEVCKNPRISCQLTYIQLICQGIIVTSCRSRGRSFSLLLNVHVIRIINDGVFRIGCLLIPVVLTTSHQGGIVTMRRIVLLATMISAIFLVTGTTCFAGSISFHRSHGLSLQHWKKGHHRFAGSRKHKRNRLLKHRHLRRHKHKFSSFGLPGGYYRRQAGINRHSNYLWFFQG